MTLKIVFMASVIQMDLAISIFTSNMKWTVWGYLPTAICYF